MQLKPADPGTDYRAIAIHADEKDRINGRYAAGIHDVKCLRRSIKLV